MQDKQELLRQWVLQDENLAAVESVIQINRTQSGEVTRGKELLTIREMKEKSFSQYLSLIHSNPDCLIDFPGI